MRREWWKPPKCSTGKAAYRTQGRSLRAIRQIQMDNAQAAADRNAPDLGTYKCRCGAWHLTHQIDRPTTVTEAA